MNAEAILMNKAGILNSVILAVEAVLRATYPNTSSSNEIFNRLPTSVQTSITAIASRYCHRRDIIDPGSPERK